MKRSELVRRLVFAAICLAIAMVLPLLTGQIQQIGNMLCPMHLPVLLCGFLCGWQWGLVVGFVSPLLRFAVFGMPPLFPIGAAMAFELATYGAIAGLLYRLLPRKVPYLYVSLLSAMLAGRAVWGLVRFAIAGLQATSFPLSAFWAGAVVNAIPGIVLQIVLIPPLVLALRRAGLTRDDGAASALQDRLDGGEDAPGDDVDGQESAVFHAGDDGHVG